MNDVAHHSADEFAFLPEGEVNALMRDRDWSASPLGAPSTWPQSLRSVVGLLLSSKFPMFVAWGPELGFLYNDPYAEILGAKHPAALGRRFKDIWPEIWPDILPLIDAALSGQSSYHEDLPLVINRKGFDEQAYFTFSYSPVQDETGRVAGMYCVAVESTDRVLAERQRSFRLTFEERLRDLGGPDEIMSAALALAGEHLGLDRVGYTEIIDDAVVRMSGCFVANGMKPLRGEFPLDSFGAASIARQRQSVTEVCDDVLADPQQDPAVWAAIDTRSFVSVPLVRDGHLRASLYANSRSPRQWTPEEVALLEEVASRTWDAVERAAAEQALRESEARLRLVQQAGGIGSFDYDLQKDQAVCSPEYYALFGLPEGHPINRETWGSVIHPDDMHKAVEALDRAIAERVPFDYEYRIVRADNGEVRWLTGRAAIVFDSEGRPWRYVGGNIDVTERKQGEEHLRELNETLEQRVAEALADRKLWADVFESSDALIGALAPDHRFLALNPAYADEFERIFGVRPKVGDNLAELLASKPEHQAAALAVWDRALAGEDFVLTEEFGDPELDRPYYELRFNTLHDREGKPIGAFQYAVDVSERLRAQAELATAQEALRQSQKMEAVGQLTGGLAHDFNNLLAGISGSLEVMGTRITQGRVADVDRYLLAAQGAAKRAAALTHRLLAFSRRQTLEPKVTSVNTLVIGMEDLIRRTVGPAIAVESALGGGLWHVMVDAPQLENSLLNLAINARDAMPDGGKLTIETANRWLDERSARERDIPAGQYVSLCVTDNGTGMAPDVIAKAFDPFFTTKPIGLGTGLGLSMVYGFARQSGGQVRIYSEVGQGTTVCLYLPRHLGSEENQDAPSQAEAAIPTGAGETVLVIDDEPVVRMLIIDVLEELGYSALEAGDGPEGLKVLQSKARVDLLITDVGLPGGLNGRQVADAARALRPDLKVLFITGYAENAVLNHGHLEHGMHVVTKPFVVEDIARKIRTILMEG